ncbi:MAG: sulfite exporter TauE/SafE family protein [Cryobacterium sp.]|uniref:sulfite exporter TauE/SafE family protein n=1 Tax=unclassified Cryobacterium TaxID=2649013 RepID=UPI0018C9435E|nr:MULTISPECIES: sulfite exporter TauE/SafE family protein [unclassified Cryobacterium]MCY7405641.1 sulfite exporter TauE/SafE family protein [Cryobacterium sp.]MEC5153337.1 putative membrane protein YfcA [Cryobacterium sp. CAN_C3]
MTFLEGVIILVAGIAAGVINVVAGAGTLITFPTLLALGVPPITANVSNTVGLVPGSIAGAYGYRRELASQWHAVGWMAVFSVVGGAVGGLLLLILPEEAFSAVVPFLLLLAAGLSAAQPRVARFVRRKAPAGRETDARPVTFGLILGILGTGVYGGYFGAAQGVVLLAFLGILWSTDLHRANGAKNVLAGTANLISAIIFISSGTVDWVIAVLIGVGSAAGGWLGARIGRRLSAPVLRTILIVVALTAAVVLFLT